MHRLRTIIVLLSIAMSGLAQNNPLDKTISISFDNISIEEALKQLESKANISLAYENNLKEMGYEIIKEYTNKSVHYILSDLLNDKNLGLKLIGNKVVIYPIKNRGNEFVISGYVYDAETGETLIGCTVYDLSSSSGTITNSYGFYSLSLTRVGDHKTVAYSFVGFETQKKRVTAISTKLNLRLQPKENQLEEVVITARHKNEEIVTSAMGRIRLSASEINAVPAIGGETDVLKAITLLPGVKQGVDGSSGFYVRGGGPDQNLILLDGVPLYNPYHLWGFLSTFNADAINNIEITKGAFPARYGGRLSSVLDITMKEGNNQKWQKDIAIGLLSAKASVSGPVVKDKSSIMISARRTYADLIAVPILKAINSGKETKIKHGYNFTDFNLKYNNKLSDKDRLFISGFYSKDKYYFKNITKSKIDNLSITETIKRDQGWGNIIGSIRWNHVFGNRLFLNTTAYYSSYNYYTNSSFISLNTNPGEMPESENNIEFLSKIEDLSFKQDYQYYPGSRHVIRFGFGGIYHSFNPGVSVFFSETGKETINNTIDHNDIQATEMSFYIEDDLDLTPRIRINAGVHTSVFLVQNTKYFSLQPRLSTRFLINENLSLKFGYSAMTQYIHLLTSSGITQSSDLWVPSSDRIKPQESQQLSIGSALLLGDNYQLELDGYYKLMKNVVDYKDGAGFLNTTTAWEDKVATGKGNSYGFELFLKKKNGKLTGWLGYTLSRTNRQFEEINFGKEYPYRYDRRHDISIVGIYKFSEKWSLNGSWVFYTGNAVTVPTYSYAAPGYDGKFHNWSSFPSPYMNEGSDIATTGIIENSESRNNYRLPTYHRLDITASRKIKKKKSDHELVFGITNLYNHFNPSFYYVSHEQNPSTNESEIKYFTKTLFPIMPTISYRISF